MTEKLSKDWFHLLHTHYNFVEIFDKNEKYSYKPFGIFKRDTIFVLKFNIVETNNSTYESGSNYRSDAIFNKEPWILQMG